MSGLFRFARRAEGGVAVEFALVLPLLLPILFGILAYGYWLTVDHGLQQLAGEAARASLAGVTDQERETIARDFVTANVASYAVIDRARLQVEAGGSTVPANTFRVAVSYDMAGLFPSGLASFVPIPASAIRRSAVIQRGGY